MKRTERLAFDTLLLAIVLTFGYVALSYESRASQIPLIAAGIAATLLLVQTWIDLRKSPERESPEDREKGAEIGWHGPLRTFLALAGFVFLIWFVGYLIAVPLFAALAMVFIGRTRWRTALGVAAGLWAFIYLLLEVLLQANLD
jgi:uncharacterized membrane protein